MRLYLGKKRKPPIGDKQHHVKISDRAFERLNACFEASTLKSRRDFLDNLILSYSKRSGIELMLEKRWREAGKRKKASKARRDGRGSER